MKELKDICAAICLTIGAIASVMALLAAFWMLWALTPYQESAECEALRLEMQERGVIQ